LRSNFPARRKNNPALRDTLRAEITDVGRQRWLAALHSSPDDQALSQVLGKREKFQVGIERLTNADRFNVELMKLKQMDWQTAQGNGIVEQRARAVENLRLALDHKSPRPC